MKTKDFIIGVIFLVVVGNIVGYFMDYLNEEKLKSNTNVIEGIFEKEIKSAYSGSVWVFEYVVNKNKHSIIEHNVNKDLQKGDTVLIEYSLDDPSIARLIEIKKK